MRDFLEVTFILLGSFFCLTAGLGFLRFPDFFTRMHSAGKVSSFGIGFYLLALMTKYPQLDVAVKSLLCLFFVVLTTPLSAQMLMRVAYLLKVPKSSLGAIDEYQKQMNSNR